MANMSEVDDGPSFLPVTASDLDGRKMKLHARPKYAPNVMKICFNMVSLCFITLRNQWRNYRVQILLVKVR